MSRSLLISLTLILLHAAPATAQVLPEYYDYARPTLEWYMLETEHFNVVFHHDADGRGSSRTAQVVARIAEEIYGPITSLYDYEPERRVSIILKDFEDLSNGAAYFFDDKIEIWAPALDSPLRGDHNWLRNVITHEFTHMVQLQAAMKSSRRMPFVYFQLLDYEDVKRPDVLYGYPDVIVSYPIPTINVPAWLAEGTAQYQRAFLDYDRWDTHRDMLLRTRILAGEELSLADMGGFYSHSSLVRENVYNHGFAFTQYLANTFGEDVLRDLSREMGRWRNWNVERALRAATGRPAADLHREWIETLRRDYMASTENVRRNPVEGDLLQGEGFSNYYPRFSPDGRRLAYVSNRGRDFNLMSLYVVDLEKGETASHGFDGLTDGARFYTCSLGHAHQVRPGVGGAVAWHPGGDHLVYARTTDTPEGFRLSDLYRLDLETEKEVRLTTNARAFAPSYAPDGRTIAFLRQSDGSANLYLFDVDGEDLRPLTRYEDGTQVTEPVWHPSGEWIYFARSHGGARDLYRLRPGGDPEVVHATDADERSPAVDREGAYLYFSSDASGIFNLYRLPLAADGGPAGAPERLTNVLGGAFMPDVAPDGALAFARFDWDGYKIARLPAPEILPADVLTAYGPPAVLLKTNESPGWGHLRSFDDTDVRPLPGGPIASSAGSVEADGTGEPSVTPYGAVFTPFNFYPVLRLDQYASRRETTAQRRLPPRSYGQTLLRNTKAGFYVTSREILEEMSFLGGLLLAPGSTGAESASEFFEPSNLLKLERDLFLLFNYGRGFGVMPRRWSPQISIELFNVRRNVENGLAIEEFPCTACYPDTTLVDLSYNLWEGGVYARGKINRNLLLEAGFRYSPYRVVTERFFSREAGQFIPETGSRYFIGRALTFGAYYKSENPHRHSNVLPEQLRLEARLERETGRLLEQFEVKDGILVPSYRKDVNYRFTVDARYGGRLPGMPMNAAHGLGLRLRGSTIVGPSVPGFYNDYVGGLIGARGYPFYALGGNETLWFQAAYHFPILPRLSRQILFAYADKLYGRAYVDAAMAWSGRWPGLGEVRRDVGLELRLGIGSFYLLPTALFLSATYGLDAFDFVLDEGFVTPDGSGTVRYGNELLWHFGILFNFDL